jgi:hypothetical protein
MLGLAAGGVGSAALAGCGVFDHASTPAAEPMDNLEPLLIEAVALAAAYDRAVVAQPGLAGRLTPLADDHRAHARELAALIGKAVPSASTSEAAPPAPASGAAPPASAPTATATATVTAGTVLAQLRVAEQTAQRNAVAVCGGAPAEGTELIGSIAACRATHAEALR